MTPAPPEFPEPGQGASMTPHKSEELQMVGHPPPSYDRPYREVVKIFDEHEERYRPAVITYPAQGPYAVVHTAEDHGDHVKWKTQGAFRTHITPRIKEWDAPDETMDMVEGVVEGDYDEQAREAGFDSPFSYIMHLEEVLAGDATTTPAQVTQSPLHALRQDDTSQ